MIEKSQNAIAERTQPLLERERELAAISAAIERAEGGEGSLVLIEGAAGIGKTRLLAEATAIARERGLPVRSARGGELERGMPFGIARQLLEQAVERASMDERERLLTGSASLALAALGRADPEAAPAGDPFAPIHGLYWLVANLAETQPLLLAIDDAHWGDAQTLRFLDYLARRLDDLPVLVVACARSGEADEPAELEPLRLEAELVRPDPLTPPAVGELIAAELGAYPSTQLAAACAKATAGNPFLLAEVLRALRADRIEPPSEAATAITALGPESVARHVLVRLGRFGADAVALARAIAVLGGVPQLRHAALLAELDERPARELCGRLREAEILAPGLPLDFVHPLVRSAIYRDLSEEERSVIHRRAAEILSETGSAARDVAPHLVTCAPNGDQWVVGQLGEAAWEAIRSGAYDGAVAYLRRALDEPPDDEFPIRYALGRGLIQTDPDGAPSILDEVAKSSPVPRIRHRALRAGGFAHSITGDWRGAAQCFATLIEELPDAAVDQRLALEGELQNMVVANGRDPGSSRRIQMAALAADESSPGGAIARQALAFDLFMAGAPVSQVIPLASSFPPEPWNARTGVSTSACKVLAACGSWQRARNEIIRIRDSWSGMSSVLVYWTHFAAGVERIAGALLNAEAEARTAMEIAAGLSSATVLRHGVVALVSVLTERGELDEAETLVELHDFSARQDVWFWPSPVEVRGYLSLAQGDFERGVEDLTEFGEDAERKLHLNPAAAPWRPALAPALAALDRTAEAEEIITVAEQRARAFGAAHVIGTVLRSRGLIEPKGKAIETLRESVGFLEQYGPPHELSRSLLELGSLLRRKGNRSEAREPLQRALELAAKSGAGGTERRAREELAAIGSRPRSAYRSGVASLTASELRTAKLAAEGLNNREIAERLFVTRRTVETHLTHVYSKLEIDGRNELPAALEDEVVTAP